MNERSFAAVALVGMFILSATAAVYLAYEWLATALQGTYAPW